MFLAFRFNGDTFSFADFTNASTLSLDKLRVFTFLCVKDSLAMLFILALPNLLASSTANDETVVFCGEDDGNVAEDSDTSIILRVIILFWKDTVGVTGAGCARDTIFFNSLLTGLAFMILMTLSLPGSTFTDGVETVITVSTVLPCFTSLINLLSISATTSFP